MKNFILTRELCAAAFLCVLLCSCVSDALPDGKSVLKDVERAIASRNTVSKIHSARIESRVTRPNGKEIHSLVRYKAPNRYRFDAASSDRMLIVTLRGVTGWGYDCDGGAFELDANEVRHLKFEVALLPFVRNMKNAFAKIETVGREMLDGTSCYLLQGTESIGFDGVTGRFWIDEKTFLPRQVELDLPEGRRLIRCFDYTPYDGVQLPETIVEVEKDGVSVTTIESVRWNVELGDSLFDPVKPLKGMRQETTKL